jgi:catechol 2,3-dioxygenase-like lactoylglutathione lyase family enzyme
MLQTNKTFASFSVDDLQEARRFYEQTLGVRVVESKEGLELHPGDTNVFIYPKPES